MPSAPTKLQRWLDVVAFLATRRLPVSTEDLWSHVPAYAAAADGSDKDKARIRRTFERDKDELRALGIPIETVQYSINYGREEVSGYRLAKRDFQLPYLKLLQRVEDDDESALSPATPVFEMSQEEAGAALEGMRTLAALPGFPLARAARSAFRKLAFDLEPDAVGEVPLVYADDPETAASRDVLHVLSDGVQRRKRLSFRYRSMASGSEEERQAWGYGLLFQHGRWYLVAHDLARDGVRMFRAGRMSDVSVNPKTPGTPDYEVPGDFALEDFSGRKAWELGAEPDSGVAITVRFRFPRSLWAARNGYGQLIEEDESGAQLRQFTVHRVDPFLRWVLSLAGDASVESPAALREDFDALSARVVALHHGEGSV